MDLNRMGYGAMRLAGPNVFGPPRDRDEAVAVLRTAVELGIANRGDEAMIDRCERDGITYVPYFPLGGFTPLRSETLTRVTARLDATPHQVALAWLLRHSPAIALIPGTSSVAHLRENMAAADLVLPADARAELDRIG